MDVTVSAACLEESGPGPSSCRRWFPAQRDSDRNQPGHRRRPGRSLDAGVRRPDMISNRDSDREFECSCMTEKSRAQAFP